MSAAAVRGWCPGAHTPMAAQDGLILRIRPPAGRLSAAQAQGLAEVARLYGRGVLALTTRANVQIRGIGEADHAVILARLAVLGLLDADEATERARNIAVTPFWQAGDDTQNLAEALAELLASAPALPAKFGFAVDTGLAPVLGATPADIRLERAADGTLLLRADGAALGLPVCPETAAPAALALAEWFVASGGVRQGRGRMRAHLAGGHTPPPRLAGTTPSAAAVPEPRPGPCAAGVLAAFAFGELAAATLDALAGLSDEIRLTPWRMLLLPGLGALPPLPGLIIDPASPLPRAFACTGAPGCGQALGETRALAAGLALHLPPGVGLHVSGCAKGCAHPGVADITLVATAEGFSLIRNASAGGPPVEQGLDPQRLLSHPEQIFGNR